MGLTKVFMPDMVTGELPFSMILGSVVNALDYGADPTGVADSTTAIQEALDTGKQVFIPKGKYKTTATLIVPSGGGIKGEGASNNNLRYTQGTWIVSSASTAIQVGTASDYTVQSSLDSFSVSRDGFVDGGSVSGTGIFYLNSAYISSRDIYIEGFSSGLTLGDDSVSGTFNLGMTFINTNIAGCDVCITATNCADVSFYGGRIGFNGVDANRQAGVVIQHNVNSFTAYRLIIANNSGFDRNVLITSPTGGLFWITFENCDMETATLSSVAMAASALATYVTVRNCWIGSLAPFNVQVGNGRVLIEGNTFPATFTDAAVVIRGDNVTVKNNDFLGGSGGAAVYINVANNIKVVENYINGTYPNGVLFDPASSSTCKNVLIEGNQISNSTDTGVNINTGSGMSNVIVTNNQVTTATNYGIRVGLSSGQTTPSKSNIRIDGNTCVAPSAGGITIADTGLDYYMIVNNDVSNTSTKITNGSTGTHYVTANNLI